jgi:beta-lactamase superfamily II metal-dependent hydrolase
MRASIAFVLAFAVAVGMAAQQRRNTLDIYVVDVEGGNGTLFVAPSGQSLLMDTGNANGAVRDAERIVAAAKDAGLTQIDHLIITHWHGDHFGGASEVAARIPIREFIDHGPNAQPGGAADEFLQKVYPQLYAKGKHTVVKAGDKIAIDGLDVRVVASAGQFIKTPLPGGGGANPECGKFKPFDGGNAEDPMSVGISVRYGKFRTAHFGDILKNQEFAMMCPNNPLGTVDLLLGLHHGQASSNSPVLVHALRPRVGIMNDGTRKGGEPDTMMTVATSPGFEDLWQTHFSLLSGQEYTQPGMFIANIADDAPAAMPIAPMAAPQPGPGAPPAPVHNGPAYWIKVSARDDGTFTVTNQRNGFSKTYAAR